MRHRFTLLAGAAAILAVTPMAASQQATAAYTPRFPGDPGIGRMRIGMLVQGTDTALSTVETKLARKPSVVRRYDGNSGTVAWDKVRRYKGKGQITSYAFTTGGRSYSSIAAGQQNGWIDGLIAGAKSIAPWPVWLQIEHEPTRIFTANWQIDQYRMAKRYIAKRFLAAGVRNVAWEDVGYMNHFDWNKDRYGRYKVDWRRYMTDWKGTGTLANPQSSDFYQPGDPNALADIINFDCYNWWKSNHAGSDQWIWLDQWVPPGVNALRVTGKPLDIGEYATKKDYVSASKVTEWFNRIYNYGLQHNIVSMSYFSAKEWTLQDEPSSDPRTAALRGLMDRTQTAKVG